MTFIQRFCILFLAVSFMLPAAASAAKGGVSPEDVFGEVVDVRVVNMEVVVSRRGHRIEGLQAEDFRLLVDGQQVPIDYFTEVRYGSAVDAASAPGTTASAVPALSPGQPVGTRYLVFIDDTFTISSYRNRVVDRLTQQLGMLGPEDRMAVVAFDGRQVEMITSWTRSPNELRSAFAQVKARPAYGLQRRNEERVSQFVDFYSARYLYNDFFDDSDLYGVVPGSYEYSRYGFASRALLGPLHGDIGAFRMSQVVSAATAALRSFAQPEGRKVMLMLSGGWPVAPEAWVPGANYYGSALGGRVEGQRLVAPLVDTANLLGYTLYPVDVDRSPYSHAGGAQYRSARQAATAQYIARERDWYSEGTFVHLASETGGEAILDNGSLKALERVIDDTRSYYWLGFMPDWNEDDTEHKVEVEVQGQKVKIRARSGYADLSRTSSMTMWVESAHLLDVPLPGEGTLQVDFGQPAKSGFRKVTVPVRLEVPLDQVTLMPDGSGYVARLELRVAASELDGDRAPIPIVPVELRGPEAPAEGATAVFETNLRLRKKPHRLLLSLYDPLSGALIAQRAEVGF